MSQQRMRNFKDTAHSVNRTVARKVSDLYGKRAGKVAINHEPMGVKPSLNHPPRANYSN